MKIVFYRGRFVSIDGAAEVIVNYASALRKAGHQPRVLLANLAPEAIAYHDRVKQAGVPLECLADLPICALLRTVRKATLALGGAAPAAWRERWSEWDEVLYRSAVAYFNKTRPDVVHVVGQRGEAPAILRAAQTLRIPVLYHEMVTPDPPDLADRQTKAFLNVLPGVAGVAGLSPQHVRLCADRFSRPFAILPMMLHHEAHDRPAREAGSGVHFGYAARLDEAKGPHVLIEAFARAIRNLPDARLTMIGGGPDEQKLKERARELGIAGQCRFLGFLPTHDDVLAVMRELDVFVMPSFMEGTPNTILETMALGLPVVASNVGGIPDLVAAEETGILVPAGDPESLGAALARIGGDAGLRTSMGGAARKRYDKLFSPEAVLPVLCDTYRRILAAGPAPAPSGAAVGFIHPWVPVLE